MANEEKLNEFNILRTSYVKLLNDKDVLLNWGKPQLEALYATKIGVHKIEQLKLQLRIKALQRKRELVRSRIARDLPVNLEEIEQVVAGELQLAEANIMQQSLQVEMGKHLLAHLATPERSAELRNIFRSIAKQIHPDVNPDLSPEQIKLWHLSLAAYKSGDLERLKALRVAYSEELTLSERTLEDLDDDTIELRIQVLKEGVKVLNDDIDNIKQTFSFDMEAQIKDDEWVKNEVAEIEREMKKLRAYEGELILEYQTITHAFE